MENVYRKVPLLLWNVYRYFETYSNMSEPAAKNSSSQKSKNILDSWINIRTMQLTQDVTENLDAYDTVHATRAIQDYVSDLSTWYLRRSRKRKDEAFFRTLRQNLIAVSKIMAPFMPLFPDALYISLESKGKQSVHLEDWPLLRSRKRTKTEEKLLRDMATVRNFASAVLAKRAELGIKVRQPLRDLKVKDQKLKGEKELLEILKDEINVKQITFDKNLKEEFVLDTEITRELREEGMLRELTRTIQGLRQDAKLEPKDRIALMMDGDKELAHIVEENTDFIKRETNAASVEWKRSEKFEVEFDTKLDEAKLWIGLRRI